MLATRHRCSSSCDDPRISPLTSQYEWPRPLPSIIASPQTETDRRRRGPLSSFHAYRMQACTARSEHSNFFKVNVPAAADTRLRAPLEERPPILARTTRKPSRSEPYGDRHRRKGPGMRTDDQSQRWTMAPPPRGRVSDHKPEFGLRAF